MSGEETSMGEAVANGNRSGSVGSEDDRPGEGQTMDVLALASVALSSLGFLTLLRLADRRDRSPAKALGLFLATSVESTLGTALGAQAVKRNREEDGLSRGLLLGAAGFILGVVTTLLNVNWMRTKRRL